MKLFWFLLGKAETYTLLNLNRSLHVNGRKVVIAIC